MNAVPTIFPHRRCGATPRRGFTLIEAALVTVIIGVGVMAMLQLLAAGTVANTTSTELTTGINLANNIRELAQSLEFRDPLLPTNWGPEAGETLNGTRPYNDLDDFDGLTFSPPIDARRQTLNEFPGWSQTIDVRDVDPDWLAGPPMPKNMGLPMRRVTVTVSRGNKIVSEMSWLTVDPDEAAE